MENTHVNPEQLAVLVQSTKQLAEELLENRQAEKNNDRKVDIIGTSMIRQRDTLQSLVEDSNYAHNEMLKQVLESDQQRENLDGLVELSNNRFESLQKTHVMQHEFIASFDRLHEKHQKLVEANNNNYEEHKLTVNMLVDAVHQLQLRIERVDIVDQVAIITREASLLHNQIQTYISNRKEFQTTLQDTVSTLDKDITDFNHATQLYRKEIGHITEIVKECSTQAIDIDRKFDMFIEQYDIKVRYKASTLDNTFEQPSKEEGQSKSFFAKLFGGDNNE